MALSNIKEPRPQTQGPGKFRVKRGSQQQRGVFDPENPFTHWLLGTDACNEEFERQRQAKRQAISAGGSRAKRLSRLKQPTGRGAGGKNTREGFFRQLKNDLNEIRYDKSKEDILRNNIKAWDLKQGGAPPEIDFDAMVFKAKRIPVKKYIEYKREIRLSNLKQVDIAANVTDMKNLIVKADEELEENIGTEKKSLDEVNQAVNESRRALEEAKTERLKKGKELGETMRTLSDIKNKTSHVDNAVRDIRDKIMALEENREFLLKIAGVEDRRAFFDEYEEAVAKNEEPMAPVRDLEEIEETVLLTALGKADQDHPSNKEPESDGLDQWEAKNPLLAEFGSISEVVDRLRRIETDNLDIIQQSQHTMEEIVRLEGLMQNLEEDRAKQVGELNENIRRLEEMKQGLEREVRLRKEAIEGKGLLPQKNKRKKTVELKEPFRTSKKELPEEEGLNVGQWITKIFSETCTEQIKKQYKGGSILSQLLGIERSVDILLKSQAELAVIDKDYWKPRKAESHYAQAKKAPGRNAASARGPRAEGSASLRNQQTRKDMGRTFLQEKKTVAKVDLGDKEREEFEKYFREGYT